jgi:hypothetical protein
MNARFHQLLVDVFCSGCYLPDMLIGNSKAREEEIKEILKKYPDVLDKINSGLIAG